MHEIGARYGRPARGEPLKRYISERAQNLPFENPKNKCQSPSQKVKRLVSWWLIESGWKGKKEN
jgi:hypothetical protein